MDELNEAAKLFNAKLSARLVSINDRLVDAVILYGDAYNLPLSIILHPHRYGICMTCCMKEMEFVINQLITKINDRIQEWRKGMLWDRDDRGGVSMQICML